MILISFFDSLFISSLCHFRNRKKEKKFCWFSRFFYFISSKLINNEKAGRKFAFFEREKLNYPVLACSYLPSFTRLLLPEDSFSISREFIFDLYFHAFGYFFSSPISMIHVPIFTLEWRLNVMELGRMYIDSKWFTLIYVNNLLKSINQILTIEKKIV